MIEPEIIFADLDDVMDLAEDYIKYCIRYVMVNNADDIEFFNSFVNKELKAQLENVGDLDKPLRYTFVTSCVTAILKDMTKFRRGQNYLLIVGQAGPFHT